MTAGELNVQCGDRSVLMVWFRRWNSSADGCRRLLSLLGAHQFQELLGLRDLGHSGLGEEAPALQLTFHLLLQQVASHQPGDRVVVGEDAD